MMEDASSENEKFDESKERYDTEIKLRSGEVSLDSNMDAVKDIARESPSSVLKIFENDMEKITNHILQKFFKN